jgi:hypothetical protein
MNSHRLLIGVVFVGIAACAGAPSLSVNASGAPKGDYVEGRTATIFAGPCHYASEQAQMGREAVMAWHLSSGAVDGVSLAGVDVVAVVAADVNLEHADAPRASVVYVSDRASAAQAAAAESWLGANHAAALGQIVAVKRAPVVVSKVGDRFEVKAAGVVEMAGAARADRKCCSMPNELWYVPLAAMGTRVVGSVETFRQNDPDLGHDFSFPADNCAFVGTF